MIVGHLLAAISSLAVLFLSSAQAISEETYIRLEGIKEKCLVEELPEKTVILVKHAASPWSTASNTKIQNAQLNLLVTARDPTGHTVTRQQNKPDGKLFLTAATTGDHLICFQAMLSQYSPNVFVKLAMEIFIGDAGDPHITSPIEAQLNDLPFQISKAIEQVSDIQREQALQRDREGHFRERSQRINTNVIYWGLLQVAILTIAAFYQVHHLRRFFRAKKLV